MFEREGGAGGGDFGDGDGEDGVRSEGVSLAFCSG